MNRDSNTLSAAVVVVSAVLLSACVVSKERLVEKERALEVCTGELRGCRTELDSCRSDSKRLQDELSMRSALCEELDVRLEKVQEEGVETREFAEREAKLREQLAAEIAAKNVRIKNLEGRLSVQMLDRILFRSGSAAILPGGRTVLDKVANVIKGGDSHIRIEGHTDNVPIGAELKRKYFSNWELSGARAASVVRHFQDKHEVEPTRMEAVGHSKYHPVAPNDTEANREKNRRVEIVLTDPK